MDKLAAYKLDKAFTEGVSIPLDKADVVAIVRLPSQYNRGYSQALYTGVNWRVDKDGNIDATSGDLLDTRYAQQDAFIAHCIVSIDGQPAPTNMAEEYPDLLSELMEKANDLAADIDAKVDDSTKKSSPSSAGSESGQEKVDSDSMPTLNAQAS